METAALLDARHHLETVIDELLPPGPPETVYSKPILDQFNIRLNALRYGAPECRLVANAARERIEKFAANAPDLLTSGQLRQALLECLPRPQ